MKSNYKYSVNLHALNEDPVVNTQALSFTISNHDDLFQKLQLVEGKLNISDDETKSFMIGLKMFSEIILKNYRSNPLFDQMFDPMKSVMKLLKSHIKQTS